MSSLSNILTSHNSVLLDITVDNINLNTINGNDVINAAVFDFPDNAIITSTHQPNPPVQNSGVYAAIQHDSPFPSGTVATYVDLDRDTAPYSSIIADYKFQGTHYMAVSANANSNANPACDASLVLANNSVQPQDIIIINNSGSYINTSTFIGGSETTTISQPNTNAFVQLNPNGVYLQDQNSNYLYLDQNGVTLTSNGTAHDVNILSANSNFNISTNFGVVRLQENSNSNMVEVEQTKITLKTNFMASILLDSDNDANITASNNIHMKSINGNLIMNSVTYPVATGVDNQTMIKDSADVCSWVDLPNYVYSFVTIYKHPGFPQWALWAGYVPFADSNLSYDGSITERGNGIVYDSNDHFFNVLRDGLYSVRVILTVAVSDTNSYVPTNSKIQLVDVGGTPFGDNSSQFVTTKEMDILIGMKTYVVTWETVVQLTQNKYFILLMDDGALIDKCTCYFARI